MRKGQSFRKSKKKKINTSNLKDLNKLKNLKQSWTNWKIHQKKVLFGFSHTRKSSTKIKQINRRNDCWLYAGSSVVPSVMHTNFLETIIALWVVNNERHMMPFDFFPQDFRVNCATYIEVLKTIVKPWTDSVWNGRPYVFQ